VAVTDFVIEDGRVRLSGSAAGEENPDRVDWLMRRRADSLRQVLQFAPVVGLHTPPLEGEIGSWHVSDDERSVTLLYGARNGGAGPYVEVRTHIGNPPLPRPLAELLADERDRLFDQDGVDEPEPVRTAEAAVDLAIDAVRTPARIRREDGLWAAQLTVPGELGSDDRQRTSAVSVLARGLPAEAVTLTVIGDLSPLATAGEAGYRARLEAARDRPRPEPQTPVGLEGHQALVAYLLSEPRPPRRRQPPRRRPEDHGALWQSAVLGQMRLAGQSRDEADHAVSLLVNQLLRLAETVPWWESDGDDAITESIRYTVFDSDVASRSAQVSWPGVFDQHRSLDPAADRLQVIADRPAAQWSAAWNDWQARRHG
jgi:hypothetical protein